MKDGGDGPFFNGSMTLDEIERLENQAQNPNDGGNTKSPVYFMNSPPPGITPTRYQQKTYSFGENEVN
eukprot:CAMPEP_0114575942 /NCGR_PEP_ID=MMETSP0125-20121206/754_1 /TAXON_ID=485358 ORGANISM="Aristerostoma sp., Strain ATCC 50986" /NCGR_SAMPLE_ID=MMETSP0125 /ASSEMBLY_ACC=CAM_ASM_000245 /LENGTH=67 /DNA_ID=CAMNT_0001764061 /DNA_START=910 /DNA_END=1113 /DNA_ORIENTATION=+